MPSLTTSQQLDQVVSDAATAHSELQITIDSAMTIRDTLLADLSDFCSNNSSLSAPPSNTTATESSALSSLLGNIESSIPAANSPTVSPDVTSLLTGITKQTGNSEAGARYRDLVGSNDTLGNTTDEIENFPTINVAGPLEQEMTNALLSLESLGDFLSTELEDGLQAINISTDFVSNFKDKVEDADIPNTAAIIMAFPWILVPSYLMLAVILAWNGSARPSMVSAASKFVMPFFCFMTMSSIILAIVMVTYAISNAGKKTVFSERHV